MRYYPFTAIVEQERLKQALLLNAVNPAVGGVLIVGAGQSGLATAFGLMRSQVTNILVLDKSAEGQEGPWLTYARMHTLRSPKHFTGPDLDIPSLTYQSWHEARFGEEDWRKFDLISRELWAEYLLWFRRIADLGGLGQCGCGAARGRNYHRRDRHRRRSR